MTKRKITMLPLNEREGQILEHADTFKLWSKNNSYEFKKLTDLIDYCKFVLNYKAMFKKENNNDNYIIYAIANSLPNQTTPADACIGNFK